MGSSEIRPFKETGKHSYNRRAINHNYRAPFIYHIILKKTIACDIFGTVKGDAGIAPRNQGCAQINESELGATIAKAIIHLPYEYPIIKLHQFCVMPDHVHILLQVLFWTDRHLDFYIEALRKRIAFKHSKKIGATISDEDIFEVGYCDKPLYENRSLDALYRYIAENPHRLAMRQQYPQFFQRVRTLKISNRNYEAYGNLFLFRNPDKSAVIIRSAFTPKEVCEKKKSWLRGAEKGTVLVSPFISKSEKSIRAEAEKIGANIILITHEAFGERFKPAAHDFDLCSQGRLLIISLGLPLNTPLTRETCLQMNKLASIISEFAD